MWANLTLCSDADLGALEPQAVAAGSPWGAVTWASARAEAKRELRILVETSFSDTKNAAERILDVHRPDFLLSLIGSAYTDLTAQGTDRYEDDLDLTAIFANSANRLYLGADYQFDGIFVLMKDALNIQTPRTLTAKYSGPAGFAALTAIDGTVVGSKTLAQSGRITWASIPADWYRRAVGPYTLEAFYWVELSIDTALSSGATKAAQILAVRAPDGLKRVATLLALGYVLNGLERQAGKPKDWQDKAAYYREQGLALFQLLKDKGGIPLDVNRDSVLEVAEEVNPGPVRLGRA